MKEGPGSTTFSKEPTMAVAKSKKLIKAEARYEKVSKVLEKERAKLEKEGAGLDSAGMA